jgi:multidrug resistance efflux pump
MSVLRKNWWIGLAIALVIGSGTVWLLVVKPLVFPATNVASGAGVGHEATGAISVVTLRPKCDPHFAMTVDGPAYVEAYYQADLMARVAGPVRFIQKDKGDPVSAGERLIEIAVPDLMQEVVQKQAVVTQRQKERDLAEKYATMAKQAVTVAEKNVHWKATEIQTADANAEFRKKEMSRIKGLSQGSKVLPDDIADEQFLQYQSATFASAAARDAWEKAKSEQEEAQAKWQAAEADVQLKEALIQVATEDLKHSQEVAGFATLRAPFDGVITARYVGPGSFVQNATTAHTEPLLTIQRTDIVTIYLKVPDVFAPYVSPTTQAEVEMSELPGRVFHGKITRFAPSLQTPENDRTLRVEVDLYNGSADQYQQFLAKEKALGNADLKGGLLPTFPKLTEPEENARSPHPMLMPGMVGSMKLVLREFENAYLLRSSAVFYEGGKPYVYLVQDHKARLKAVEVQVDDGKLAKVRIVERDGSRERKRDLTPDDEVIISNQSELSDGQAVKSNRLEWD